MLNGFHGLRLVIAKLTPQWIELLEMLFGLPLRINFRAYAENLECGESRDSTVLRKTRVGYLRMSSVRIDLDRAIVLGITPHGDNSRIVKVLSRSLGVVALWVPLGSGKKRQLGMWHPGALLEISGLQRKGSEGLLRFKEARRAYLYEQLVTDVKRSSVAFFLSEVVMKTFPDESAHPELLDLLWETLQNLDTVAQTGWVHVRFLGQLISHLGLAPTGHLRNERDGLDLQTGEWQQGVLEDEDHFGPKLARVFVFWTLDSSSLEDPFVLNSEERRKLVLGQVRYLQHHLSGPRTIKSYEVLESVFSS
ncbi:MAG: DNA repair protein RecO C-terminal domain-containing protein [Flavobacteriales bacterium]|jgi:DNA repair protein RecO (recombination protein O)|nr:DNA repair protein RecO C-terminal domain-containing protein [Flavobacteriales bacterium]